MKKHLLNGLALVAIMALTISGISFFSAARANETPPPGSYMATCDNITLEGSAPLNLGKLKARCKKADGSMTWTELQYDIANCNGQLKYGGC